MFRSILLASTLAVALTGTAFAQGASYGGPRMIGGGPDAEVVYDAPSDNVVGGGYARITGEAGNPTIAYGRAAPRPAPTRPTARSTPAPPGGGAPPPSPWAGAPPPRPPAALPPEFPGEPGTRHVTYHAPGAVNGGQLAGNPARTGG